METLSLKAIGTFFFWGGGNYKNSSEISIQNPALLFAEGVCAPDPRRPQPMGLGEHSHISGLAASSPAERGELEGPSRHQDSSLGSLTSSEMPGRGVCLGLPIYQGIGLRDLQGLFEE